MAVRNIEELLYEFQASADDSGGMLRKILSVVSEGRVPSEAEVEKLDECIGKLRGQYSAIYSYAVERVSEEEMPAEGASAEEYVRAVRNSEAEKYRRQLEECRRILKEFLSVRSLTGIYAEALQPFQERAAELAAMLLADDFSGLPADAVLETEKLACETAGPKAFLNALTCDNLDSDEGMRLLDETEQHYPRRIQYGLVAGKYCISETALLIETAAESEEASARKRENESEGDLSAKVSVETEDASIGKAEDEPEDELSVEVSGGSEDKISAKTAEKSENASIKEAGNEPSAEAAGGSENAPVKEAGDELSAKTAEGSENAPVKETVDGFSAETVGEPENFSARKASGELEDGASGGHAETTSNFVRKIEASGLLLETDAEVGSMTADISANEGKKATASVFQNDVRKGHEKAIKAILREVVRRNNISLDTLCRLQEMPEGLAQSSLEYLQRKGYLRSYALNPGGEFYCASQRLMKCMAFRDAAKTIGVSRKEIKDWGETIEDRATSVASRVAYGKLFCDSMCRFRDTGYASVYESALHYTECFFSRIHASGKADIGCDIIIGAFWQNTEECDSFLKEVKEELENVKPVKAVVFAALDQGRAKNLAGILLAELGNLLLTQNVYLYSLTDGEYSDFFEGSAFRAEDLWNPPETEKATPGCAKAAEKAGKVTESAEAASGRREALPGRAETPPERANQTAGNAEAMPGRTETPPERAGAAAGNAETTSERMDISLSQKKALQRKEGTPERKETRTESAENASGEADVTAKGTEDAPEGSERRTGNAETASGGAGVTAKETDAMPEGMGNAPERTEVTPAGAEVSLENSAASPEGVPIAESMTAATAVPILAEAGGFRAKAAVRPSENPEEDIVQLINSGRIYAAMAYARAFAAEHPEQPDAALFCRQLAYAVNDPMEHCSYETGKAFQLLGGEGEFEDALVLSTAIRLFFSNQVRYDYNLKSYYSGIKEYALPGEYPALSNVMYTLMDFKDTCKKGMDACADYRSRSRTELEREMNSLRQEARIFYDNVVAGRKKERAGVRRFLETKKLLFAASGDLGQWLRAVVDGDTQMQPLVQDFLQENFFKKDSTIEPDNIDADMLWAYIMVYWDQAGESLFYQRRENLMSHLRTNITSTTTKAVQLLARWCDLVNRINSRTEDDGDLAYRRVRKYLMENLTEAIRNMMEICADAEQSRKQIIADAGGTEKMAADIRTIGNRMADTGEAEKAGEDVRITDKESAYAGMSKMQIADAWDAEKREAGARVLAFALQEILACVDGSFAEDNRKYFYLPFLLTEDVLLDEDYFPDLDMHSSSMRSLAPLVRILRHAQEMEREQPTYRERLNSILNEKGDDYGSARLIADYLETKMPSDEWEEISVNIDGGEGFAREAAEVRRDDFIGNIELAQSYGQIDNSVEDKKEKILQVVEEWYQWALTTSNYGFFRKVMDSYLAEIREEAKSREKNLLEQLENFKSAAHPGISEERKSKRAARILDMIREQNYTVAEDLLARSGMPEEEQEEVIEEDFLKEFLNHYEDYYQPVAARNDSFANLISSRTRNKEQRGARRLADNWLPGGSDLGETRLENLLSGLGFRVAEIRKQAPIQKKHEHYLVWTEKAASRQRNSYSHPIAAFGSSAAIDGFRVVCINGAYNADSLIEIMKAIGDTKHTMILYDNALPLSERRRLARKTKTVLGDKLFAVVDRAVMMFLVRNFDETRINKMLISLITPFGYYQPYVWESANVMPPEIFMGRRRELEKIKSPTGVNIVYGGRQLGKSALLKKAREDIDRDESGNRAVLVDVKGLDYRKAARKIAHELYDVTVLKEDMETESWDELARAVRRRLLSENEERIPYLLLLIDEADTFIDSCAAVNYQPFDALKEIQSIGAGRFKFVIAGLRNIVRFKREALDNNSVLTHLQPMTVKPFNTAEARELMEIPLHYLGMQFPKEKESLITLILATTNYFPGLIQLYCAKLVNALRNNDYANYNEVNTPIYEVSEDHIKKVLADPEFTQQIREKYFITLKLDEDNYYYLIALLLAYLYHNNGYNVGYSAEDIKRAGDELEIAKIAALDNARIGSFMEELKELNVLRTTDELHYLFTRFTFFQMMGTRAEVEDKLAEYMG
ncbi:MAG: hypothetical protein LUE29_12480 [Lachnospiraceae bacterium]|nr:hypothetical protein [Lachnospiraceae bacterium]